MEVNPPARAAPLRRNDRPIEGLQAMADALRVSVVTLDRKRAAARALGIRFPAEQITPGRRGSRYTCSRDALVAWWEALRVALALGPDAAPQAPTANEGT